jgi:hypothetical protein
MTGAGPFAGGDCWDALAGGSFAVPGAGGSINTFDLDPPIMVGAGCASRGPTNEWKAPAR